MMQQKQIAHMEQGVFKKYRWDIAPGVLCCRAGRYEEDMKYVISAGLTWLDERPNNYIDFTKKIKTLEHRSSQNIECLKDILLRAAHSIGADDIENLLIDALMVIQQVKLMGWDVFQASLRMGVVPYAVLVGR